MRARNIKPDFFSDDELAELQPLARILFAGLWCQADRDGRMKDRPKKLKSLILPFDKCNIDTLLAALAPKFITRYQVNGCRYIQVNTFKQHQNPHKNEKSCNYPAPQDVSSNYASAQVITGSIGMIDDTGLMIDERGLTQSETDYGADFEEWWRKYPNKQGKDRALVHYYNRRKAGQSREALIQARDRYIHSKDDDRNPTWSHGSTFLNPKPQSDSANINDWFTTTPTSDTPTLSREFLEKMLASKRAHLATIPKNSSDLDDRRDILQTRTEIAEYEEQLNGNKD